MSALQTIVLTFNNCTVQLAAAIAERVEESYQEKLPHIPLNFNDARTAFASKLNLDIVRSWAVLSACQIQPLVENADSLLAWSQKVFTSYIVNAVIKQTFFKHFCAGERPHSMNSGLEREGWLSRAREDASLNVQGFAIHCSMLKGYLASLLCAKVSTCQMPNKGWH